MKKRSLWLCPLAIAAIVALDQWVKAYIVTHFAVGESAEFLPQLLRLHYVRNFGAAWSSFSGERWLLIGVTGVGMLALAWLLARIVRHPLGVWSLTAVIGGGVGKNLYFGTFNSVNQWYNYNQSHGKSQQTADLFKPSRKEC